jgi:hypothetical protein
MNEQDSLGNELAILRRQLAESVEFAHQAIAMASAANVRIDAMGALVASLERRIQALRVESKTISEIVG